jgi:dipeptidyl aminopeptidase/acylaminoacyl peptidase
MLAVALVFALSAASQLAGQPGRAVLYRDVAISPNGKHVAWAQSGGETEIVIAPDRVVVPGSAPAWSPDSKSLAFLAESQLWTASAEGRNARKRTHLNGYVARPRWSPDGRRIAFLYVAGAGGGGPLLAAPLMTGVIGAAIHNQRIAVLDLRSENVEMASPADLHVYDYDWSPDGEAFVATAAPGPGDNNWWIAQIYAVRSGEAKSIYRPALQVAVPRWSPDGKTIACIEGLMSDEGFHGGDLFTMPASGGAAVNRTAGRKASASSLFWTASDRILFTEFVNGGSAISELSPGNGSIRTLWHGGEDIHAGGNSPTFALSSDGRASAAVRGSFEMPPEVWAGPPGKWTRLTNLNAAQNVTWGTAESLEWTSDGMRIQGWMMPPQRTEAARRYPMIVIVHGGPSSMKTPAWPASSLPALLSHEGYFVLMPNPRGSYGEGEAFTRANVRDFGGGDLRDILAGVDYAAARFPIDPDRLGITGHSYGGYMTMWAVTQTNRFRAAVAGAGIANWQSYYGENLIDQWMIPFFGASVYDDPAVYEKSSPIHFIKAVKTPTLVVAGERDAECPAPQSYEFWHALRTLGVPTELVVYAGEGHAFADPKNRVDSQERTLAWFEKYLR